MNKLVKTLFEKYYKFSFTLLLLAFVLSILLMNIPRLLAGEIVAQAHDAGLLAVPASKLDASWQDSAEKLVHWKVSTPPHAMTGEGSYVEFKGSRMAFTVRF